MCFITEILADLFMQVEYTNKKRGRYKNSDPTCYNAHEKMFFKTYAAKLPEDIAGICIF